VKQALAQGHEITAYARSKRACQRTCRRRWQRKLKSDAGYRTDQAAAQRRGHERHPDYWWASVSVFHKAYLREGVQVRDLIVHADNGGPMKGPAMLATLQRFGAVPSFIRPGVSDDNPYSEALFKTLKYCPDFPSQPFAGRDDARAWVRTVVLWYNEIHTVP
jgi:transposase InsO family protein